MRPTRLAPVVAGAALALVFTGPATASAPAESSARGAEALVVTDSVTDPDGSRHVHYDRTYAGLPVLGGDLIVHYAPDGTVRGTDRLGPVEVRLSSVTPTVAARDAAGLAAPGLVAGTATPRLVVWATGDAQALAWETTISGVDSDGTPSEAHVISDARSGGQLDRWEAVTTFAPRGTTATGSDAARSATIGDAGTGTGYYDGPVALTTTKSGASYQLKDPSRGNQSTVDMNNATTGAGTLFTDPDNKWGDGTVANRQSTGVDVQYGAAMTWDFYKTTYGRNGIKDNGKGAMSKAHYGRNYVNAFWNDGCFCMTYGDGAQNKHPLTALDVAGHEMSHGVTSATAKLRYSGESGGLNEANSDIFGTMVEFYAKNSKDVGDYLIGEKVDIFGTGKPLRYMDDPKKDGQSLSCWKVGAGNSDVHYSSGIGNHFFYLLSEGSGAKTINGVSYNSPTCDGSKVTGIGRDAAAKIWYTALTKYMTATTTYKDARAATLKAATDLYGATSAQYKAVDASWKGVAVTA